MKILIKIILIVFINVLVIPLNAQKWEAFNSGLDSNEINCMTTNKDKVFIGTRSNGVVSSKILLDDWNKINNGINTYPPGIHSITTVNNFIFASNSLGLYISNDEGNSWVIINDGILTPVYTPSSSIISFGNSIIYSDEGSIFLSENIGLNWIFVGSGGDYRAISSFANSGKYLYAGTYYGILLSSSDGGKSWEKIHKFPAEILAIASDENVLFVTTGKGVFRSNNLFDWEIENDGLQDLFAKSIAITAKYIFVATNKGIFISEKRSNIKWKPFNNGLLNLAIGYLAHSGDYLFAATYSGEVYKLDLTPLNVDDAEANNIISIYPNPAKTDVSIDFVVEPENLPNITVELYNLTGVLQSKLDYYVDYNDYNGKGTLNCNIENIPNGYYIIVIDNGKLKIAKPLIVNKE